MFGLILGAVGLLGGGGIAALVAKFGLNVVLGTARSYVQKVPSKAWLYIAIAAALVGAVVWHQHAAHKALKKADATGYARALNDVAEKQKKIAAVALALKKKMDDLTAKITLQERNRYDQDATRNHALADALRVRYSPLAGPSRGTGPTLSGPARAAGAGGGPQPQADAGLAQVPALPLIDYAEQCDNDHAARITIEEWWKRLKAKWPKPLPSAPESS